MDNCLPERSVSIRKRMLTSVEGPLPARNSVALSSALQPIN
jgi:hypothetical protein